MNAETTPRLTLTVTAGGISRFLPLLGQGFLYAPGLLPDQLGPWLAHGRHPHPEASSP